MGIFKHKKKVPVDVIRTWVGDKHFICPVHGDIGIDTISFQLPHCFAGERHYCLACWEFWFRMEISRAKEKE